MQIILGLAVLVLAAKVFSKTEASFSVRVGGPDPAPPADPRPGVAGDREEPLAATRRAT